MPVSSGAVRLFSDGMAEFYGPAGDGASQDYPARVVNVVTTLIAADSCSYNHFDGPALLARHVEPADVGAFPGSEQSFSQHLPEHPSWPTTWSPATAVRCGSRTSSATASSAPWACTTISTVSPGPAISSPSWCPLPAG